MMKINIHEAKTHLSRYLARLEERGEPIILCRRNVPVAEIRPLPRRDTEPRSVGVVPDLRVLDSFFEPLPDEVLEAFEGGAS